MVSVHFFDGIWPRKNELTPSRTIAHHRAIALTPSRGFVRRQGPVWAVTAVPRLLTRLVPSADRLPLGEVWGDTRLVLSGVGPNLRLGNVFTGERLDLTEQHGQAVVPVVQVFACFPVALFVNE